MSEKIENLDKSLITIIKKTRINFLLGAGASYKEEKGKTSYPLMKHIVQSIIENTEFQKKINDLPIDSIARICYDIHILQDKNFEEYLSSLEGLLNYPLDEKTKLAVHELVLESKKIIISRIIESDNETTLRIYENFYKNLISLNQEKEEVFRRINVFTTNYDMLTELSLENMGIHFYSGFFGVSKRKFNSAFYNFTYSDDMNLKTKSYIIKNEHVNLYKLHGSLSWKLNEDELVEVQDYMQNNNPVLIYPSHTKYNQTNLVAYYSTLMRDFLNQISNEQSSLIVIGYSFGDDHINKLIQSALSIESFTLIALLYNESDYKHLKDKIGLRANVKVYFGLTSTLEEFTNFIKGKSNEES